MFGRLFTGWRQPSPLVNFGVLLAIVVGYRHPICARRSCPCAHKRCSPGLACWARERCWRPLSWSSRRSAHRASRHSSTSASETGTILSNGSTSLLTIFRNPAGPPGGPARTRPAAGKRLRTLGRDENRRMAPRRLVRPPAGRSARTDRVDPHGQSGPHRQACPHRQDGRAPDRHDDARSRQRINRRATVPDGDGARGLAAAGSSPARGCQGAQTDQRRRASAGRMLAVGLVCFLFWLLFDANQLYRSAQAGQIGVRRTVAVIDPAPDRRRSPMRFASVRSGEHRRHGAGTMRGVRPAVRSAAPAQRPTCRPRPCRRSRRRRATSAASPPRTSARDPLHPRRRHLASPPRAPAARVPDGRPPADAAVDR